MRRNCSAACWGWFVYRNASLIFTGENPQFHIITILVLTALGLVWYCMNQVETMVYEKKEEVL